MKLGLSQKVSTKKTLGLVLGTVLVLFAFQNCGFSTSGSGSSNKGLTASQEGYLDWSPFYKSTQVSDINFQNFQSAYSFDDKSALILTDRGLSIYDSEKQTVRDLLRNSGLQLGTPLRFPSINKVAITTTDLKSKEVLLKVIDTQTGMTLFTSEPLASLSNPCLFNPLDEAQGVLLCAFPSPTTTNPQEIRVRLFNLKTLVWTPLAPVPESYNLKARWPGGAVDLTPSIATYPFPKEAKAIVYVRNSNAQSETLLLTADSATPWPMSAAYDYNGSGQTKTLRDFFSENVGIAIDHNRNKCPSDVLAYPAGFQFWTSSRSYESKLCINSGVYTTTSEAEIQKCTSPNTCTVFSNKIGTRKFRSGLGAPIYLEKTNEFLMSAFLGNSTYNLLLSIKADTGVAKSVGLAEAPEQEALSNIDGAFLVQNSLVRKSQNSYVKTSKVYMPETEKIYDVGVIADSAEYSSNWSSRRVLNQTPFLLGTVVPTGSNPQVTILNLSNRQLKKIEGVYISDRNTKLNGVDDSQISIRSPAGEISNYDILTAKKTVVATEPTGYRPNQVLRNGIHTVLNFYSTPTSGPNRIIVYKNASAIFDQTYYVGSLTMSLDSKAFYLVYTTVSAGAEVLISRFDFETGTMSAGQPCSSEYNCPFNQYKTSLGTRILTSSGKIYDDKLALIDDAKATPIAPALTPIYPANRIIDLFYFKAAVAGQSSSTGSTLYTVTSYDVKNKKFETLDIASANLYTAIGEVLVVSKVQNGAIQGTEFRHMGKTLLNHEATATKLIGSTLFLSKPQTNPVAYYHLPISELAAAANGNITSLNPQPVKVPDIPGGVTLSSFMMGRIWWQTNDIGTGKKFFRTLLP